MWRLVQKLTGYSSLVDYNGEGVEKLKPGGVPPPLDPCTVAGTAKLARMLKHIMRRNFFALSTALKFLRINRHDGYADFILKADGEKPRKIRFTNEKYQKHLLSLLKDKILMQCEPEEVRYFSTYFSVLKDLTSSRAIFNGRALSEKWKTPPPVNIPDVSQVIERIDAFGTKNRNTFAVSGDFRHWFHQITISDELARFMALYITSPGGGQAYKYRVLPMGFSYSPWLAQSCAWEVLAHRNDRDEIMVDEDALRHVGCLPTFLAVFYKGKPCGWATVYYDNYLVVVNSEEAAAAWSKRILDNASFFNVQIKEGTHKISTPEIFENSGLEYLGVRFKIHRADLKRERNTDGNANRVTWELKNTLGDMPNIKTKRDAARVIGKIMFHMVIHITPLGCVDGFADLVAILRKLALSPGWDIPHMLDEEQLSMLERRWNFTKINTPLFRSPEHRCDVSNLVSRGDVVATDAARKGYGWVHIVKGLALAPHEGHWTEEHLAKWTSPRSAKIFLMEMHAAIEGLLAFFSSNKDCEKMALVTDNSGVAYCLRKGFSTLDEANIMIKKVLHLLPRVEIVQITTKDNCADCPSRRDYKDFDARVERTKLVAMGQLGGNSSTCIKMGVATSRRSRPVEPEKIDEVSDFEDELGLDSGEADEIENCMLDEQEMPTVATF